MKRLLKWNFNRKFGIEYEFSNRAASRERMAGIVRGITGQNVEIHSYSHTCSNYNYWDCKTDSSCGIELVSPILSGPSKLKEAAEILPILLNNNFTINNRCGQHVHVEIKDFTEEQAGIIAAYWMKIERFILNGTPAHRRGNYFCQLLTERSAVDVGYEYSPVRILSSMATGRDAINFQNRNGRGTVEFRFGEMSFDPEVVKNRVRFLIWFVEMCKILHPPKNLHWMTPKQVLYTLNLWSNPSSTIQYEYSPAVQSMRKWLLSRLIEFAPVTFKKDADQCKILLEEIENVSSDQLEEECA